MTEAKSLPELKRKENDGFILEDSQRIISFRVETFQAFGDRLVSMVGAIVGRTLTYGIGTEIGQTALRYSRDEIRSEDDLGKVFDRVVTLRGWGRCLAMEKHDSDHKLVYVSRMKGTPTAHGRTATEPVCHLIRGIVAGWIEAYVGRTAKSSSEVACEATGKKFCVFETSFI